MAKDVHRALIQIAIDHGGMSEDDATHFIEKTMMREEKRYLRDVSTEQRRPSVRHSLGTHHSQALKTHDATGMEEESIGFKARLISMLLRLVTLGLIAVAIMISTEGIVIVLCYLCSWYRLRKCSSPSRAKS